MEPSAGGVDSGFDGVFGDCTLEAPLLKYSLRDYDQLGGAVHELRGSAVNA
jgi:hypothetical protein